MEGMERKKRKKGRKEGRKGKSFDFPSKKCGREMNGTSF